MKTIRKVLNGRDEGVALLSVILLMIVLTVFSVIVLGLVLSQVTPTLHTNKNSRTLGAAQAGIDAAVAQFRNATTADGSGVQMGDIHKLPCVVLGTVDGTGGATHYSTAIEYFVNDPADKDAAWRTTNKLTCYNGTGINGGVRSVPRYAIMTSEGFDDSATTLTNRADRVVEATYTFQLTTRKVSGGMILDSDGNFCLVAVTATVGSLIKYQASSDNDCAELTEFNSWSWRDDYMLHLTSTDRDGKVPLCISGRNTASATPANMTLQTCNTGTQDPTGQRFSWTGDYTWRGQNSANTAYANSYIVNQDATVTDGDNLSVANTPTNRSLTPLGAVGKGNASYATHQVVNQNLFGRCLDVTNANINYSYMIAYPCKQDPSGALAFDWNHKWYYTEPGDGVESVTTKITVNNGTQYCLITSATTGLSGNPGSGTNTGYRFPRFVTSSNAADCSSSTTQWTRYGYSPDQYKAYTIQDRNGRCLSAGGPKIVQDTSGAKAWTSIIIATCDGSDDQKWNVPDVPVGASIGDYTELTGQAGG